jgi:hypothetical protein
MAGLNTLPMVWSQSTSGRTEHHGHPHSWRMILVGTLTHAKGATKGEPGGSP